MNTACLKLEQINQGGFRKIDTTELNSGFGTLGTTWFVKRMEAEELVSDEEKLSKFRTYFEECSLGLEENFQARKLEEWYTGKSNRFAFINANRDKL